MTTAEDKVKVYNFINEVEKYTSPWDLYACILLINLPLASMY